MHPFLALRSRFLALTCLLHVSSRPVLGLTTEVQVKAFSPLPMLYLFHARHDRGTRWPLLAFPSKRNVARSGLLKLAVSRHAKERKRRAYEDRKNRLAV